MKLLSNDFFRLLALAFVLSAPIAYYLLRQWISKFSYQVELPWVFIFASTAVGAAIVTSLTIASRSFQVAWRNPVDSLRE